MSKFIDIQDENKFFDSFVKRLEQDYTNPDNITRALHEQKKARGIVPQGTKSVPVSPTRKPSRNGKFVGSVEKEQIQMLINKIYGMQ